jgi:NAD(P)-dependent dehydrogenase (short-subunit alcohol dehydrogenase family)
MRVNQSVVVVTGGVSGLGQACSELFISAGSRVAVLDLHATESERAERDRGTTNIRFYDADVRDPLLVKQVIDAIALTLGEIRVCINCAGIAPAGKVVGRNGAIDLERFTSTIEVNLIGTFNVLRLAAEKMVSYEPVTSDGARGVIINTASVAAFDGQMGQSAYAASKGGIVSMTLPLARDLARTGIRVNAIAPGIFDTAMMMAMDESVLRPLEESVPFPKRFGLPSEFAKLVSYIVDNDYINGEVIRLDGAIRMPS